MTFLCANDCNRTIESSCAVILCRSPMTTKRYTTMAEAVEDLKQRGFTTNFEFLNQAFRDVDTGKVYQADELTIVEHYRFEGASDPDDMSVVYAIESAGGSKGIIADAFGTYANPSLGRFLERVSIHEEQ
jgi:hypothetical protein